MPDTDKATPRPWAVGPLTLASIDRATAEEPDAREVVGPEGNLIATTNGYHWRDTVEAGCGGDPLHNAALIVRAVNAHAALVAALKAVVADFRGIPERIRDQARDALKLAEAP